MHPHVHPSVLNILAKGTLPYKEMCIGQVLEIHAKDSRTGSLGRFSVQVVGFEHDCLNGVHPAVFRLLDSFGFYAPNSDPVTVQADADMVGGTSEFHLPVSSGMSYIGGIAIGRDHSFLYVGAEHEMLIVSGIESIREVDPAGEFDCEDLSEYRQAVEALKARLTAERQAREAEILKAKRVVIRTANSTYEFGPADDQGVRRMEKRGGQRWDEAKLLFAERGRQMSCSVNDNGGWKHLCTSLVQEVILEAA